MYVHIYIYSARFILRTSLFFQNPKPSHLEHEFDVTLKNKKQFSEVPHLEHGIM